MEVGQLTLMALIVGLVLMLAIVFLFVFRWKTAFTAENGETLFDLVPSGVVDENTQAFKKLMKEHHRFAKLQEDVAQTLSNEIVDIAKQLIASDQSIRADQDKSYQALQAVLSTIRDLREETKILREKIQNQADELDRHKKGYDVDILSGALIPITRMHRLLVDDLAQPHLSNETKQTLEALKEECLDVLETKGIKLVRPVVGERYRDQKNIQHPPIMVATQDLELVNQIASVHHPAYELETSVRNVVLLPAIVEVYSAERKQAEDQPIIINTVEEET